MNIYSFNYQLRGDEVWAADACMIMFPATVEGRRVRVVARVTAALEATAQAYDYPDSREQSGWSQLDRIEDVVATGTPVRDYLVRVQVRGSAR